MRDAGMAAIGFVLGIGFMTFGLAAAIAEVEKGRSLDAMLARLAARSWKRDAA